MPAGEHAGVQAEAAAAGPLAAHVITTPHVQIERGECRSTWDDEGESATQLLRSHEPLEKGREPREDRADGVRARHTQRGPNPARRRRRGPGAPLVQIAITPIRPNAMMPRRAHFGLVNN